MLFQRISKARTCPVCKSPEAYRVRRAGLSVKVVCKILNVRPHWCPNCDTFFLGPRHSKEVRIDSTFHSARTPSATGQTEPHSVSH
jgi:hypothetical protein